MIRVATRNDASEIVDLLQNAPYRHIHADWRLPVDWLGSPGFVVAQPETADSFLFDVERPLQGCLVATADPPPTAWVRVAALAGSSDPYALLPAMLDSVLDFLRETAVTQLAWLVVDEWPLPGLPALGFEPYDHIKTLTKHDLNQDGSWGRNGVEIRPVRDADMPALAAIEAAAFEPLWRHSAESLALARGQCLSFDVAVEQSRPIGFQFSTWGHQGGAHLARITVDPAWQNKGVGSALLAQAIASYRQRGLSYVSLNTQVGNSASLRLYNQFGFVETGQKLPVWHLKI